MKEPASYDVLGTALRATTYEHLTDYCQQRVLEEGVISVDFTNTQIITMRRLDPAFLEQTSQVDFFIPDGMPLIWCLNQQGAELKDRVYGPTFMRYCLTHCRSTSTHFFLGGSSECLQKLRENVLSWNPKLRIVGEHHGYFGPDEDDGIIESINDCSPDFIWVGLGTPKQQAWIHRHKHRFARGALLAVGFAFDVNAGTKPDAPLWMQRCGMGWVFRLCSEPRRLLGRYAYYNTMFLWLLLKNGWKGMLWGASKHR